MYIQILQPRLLLLLLLITNCIVAQYSNNFAYDWKTPLDCNENEAYNSIIFKCKPCETDQIANRRRDKCVCKPPLKTVIEKQQNQCIPCSQGQASQLIEDISVCVDCIDVNGSRVNAGSDGKCPDCPTNSITSFYTTTNNGSSIERRTCTYCPDNTEPNEQKTKCISCQSRECLCSKNSTICDASGNQQISSVIETDSTQNFFSALIEKEASSRAAGCQLGDPNACQSLANLCVLQNYNREQNTACALLESLRTNQNSELIPPIVYANTEAPVELFRESAIDAIFNVEEGAENTELHFYLAVYLLNGTFLGLFPVNKGYLQICPTKLEVSRGAYQFGRLYSQTCRLAVSEALLKVQQLQDQFDTSGNPVFYELYIRYTTKSGQQMMYNVPILNENIRLRGEYINKVTSDSRWMLTRRFFLSDRQPDNQFRGELIRIQAYMAFNIRFQLSRDGRIFPPYFRIRYNQYYNELGQNSETSSQDEQTASFQFQVLYIIESFRHDKTIEVLMATFCSCCVLLGAFKAYSWSRRAGKLVVDASTILTFVLNVADNLGNVFLLIMGFTAVWITFAYKLQKHVVYIPLAYEQVCKIHSFQVVSKRVFEKAVPEIYNNYKEWSFLAYVISATALKGVGLLHTYLTLIFTETFFVDWERPRSGIDRSRETTMLDISTNNDMTSQRPRKTIPIVIWRTYLIANEWNELQHYRKTSIALQLISVLLLLEWFHFADYGIIQPGFSRGNNSEEFAESRMSRFAVDISVYLTVALAQWLINVLIVEKIVDPFRNFMDLCSVANISVLAFTHPLRAYYIHGRSIHGSADTDMLEMNMFLQREKENLCGLRGLESNSELQTFIVCLPKSFREKLDDLSSAMRNAARTANLRGGNDRVTTKVETSAKIHADITQFVKDFIDHADPTCDYVVNEARLIEDLLDIELTDTSRVGCFIRDHSEVAYSSVFIYGNEFSHLSFELLLFAIIDLATHSRILSAAIVYTVSVGIRSISKSFFTNNLVKSSLVDHRFLI